MHFLPWLPCSRPKGSSSQCLILWQPHEICLENKITLFSQATTLLCCSTTLLIHGTTLSQYHSVTYITPCYSPWYHLFKSQYQVSVPHCKVKVPLPVKAHYWFAMSTWDKTRCEVTVDRQRLLMVTTATVSYPRDSSCL